MQKVDAISKAINKYKPARETAKRRLNSLIPNIHDKAAVEKRLAETDEVIRKYRAARRDLRRLFKQSKVFKAIVADIVKNPHSTPFLRSGGDPDSYLDFDGDVPASKQVELDEANCLVDGSHVVVGFTAPMVKSPDDEVSRVRKQVRVPRKLFDEFSKEDFETFLDDETAKDAEGRILLLMRDLDVFKMRYCHKRKYLVLQLLRRIDERTAEIRKELLPANGAEQKPTN